MVTLIHTGKWSEMICKAAHIGFSVAAHRAAPSAHQHTRNLQHPTL